MPESKLIGYAVEVAEQLKKLGLEYTIGPNYTDYYAKFEGPAAFSLFDYSGRYNVDPLWPRDDLDVPYWDARVKGFGFSRELSPDKAAKKIYNFLENYLPVYQKMSALAEESNALYRRTDDYLKRVAELWGSPEDTDGGNTAYLPAINGVTVNVKYVLDKVSLDISWLTPEQGERLLLIIKEFLVNK